jgi:hypothetical protein
METANFKRQAKIKKHGIRFKAKTLGTRKSPQSDASHSLNPQAFLRQKTLSEIMQKIPTRTPDLYPS